MSDDARPEPAQLRQRRIRSLLAAGGFRRTADIARDLGVSSVTVRSDLEDLEAAGVLRRVRGGAIGAGSALEATFESALGEAAAGKQRIAVACVEMVRPGDTIILDAGTTNTAIATELATRAFEGLTVVTNNLRAVFELRHVRGLDIIVTGGTFRHQQHSLVDPLGSLVLERIHADIAFVGCTGVDAAAGITNVNLPEADLKRRIIDAATRIVVAADERKLGRVAHAVVCPLEKVDVLVTDAPDDHELVRELVTTGLETIIA